MAFGIIVLFSLLTLLGIFQVLNVKTEYNLRQFFPSYHYLLKQDDQVKERFNFGEEAAPFLIVATINDEEKDWGNKEYLDIVKKLTEKLKALENVKEVKNI